MDMKFPRGRRTQLKKSWKFLGIGAGKQWSPWNGAESWKVGVKLNKTSVGGMNIIKCSKYWKDWNHEAYFQPNIQNYPNNPSLPLYSLALLLISTTSIQDKNVLLYLLIGPLVCLELFSKTARLEKETKKFWAVVLKKQSMMLNAWLLFVIILTYVLSRFTWRLHHCLSIDL